MRFKAQFSVAIVLSLLTGATVTMAFDEPPAVEAALGYVSRDVFRGIERASSSAQASVDFNRDGFRGGLWTSQPLDSSGAREFNLHGAYAWQPNADLKLEASVRQSWFSGVPGGGVDRSFEGGLAATLTPIQGFAPRLAYYHDFRFRADTVELSAARSIALTKWGAFLDLNFLAGWASGDDWRPDSPAPRARDAYAYWGGEARLPYRIGAHSTLVAGLHYMESDGRSAAAGPFGLAPHRNLWVSLGVNLDF